VDPAQLAGDGVERDRRATRSGRRIEDAVDDERRALELELGTRPRTVGLEPPRHLERPKLAAVICASGE
jgi:hypothetical protein